MDDKLRKKYFWKRYILYKSMFLFFSLVLIVYVGEFDDSLTIMTTQHWLSEKRLKNIFPMAVDKITEALKKSLNSLYQEMNDK